MIVHSIWHANRGTGGPTILASVGAHFNATDTEVNLQFDVVGNVLRLYVWEFDEPKPSLPVLETTDDELTGKGVAGLLVDGRGPHRVAYRYVQVADSPIPEPSTAILSAIFFAGVFAWQWRRHK